LRTVDAPEGRVASVAIKIACDLLAMNLERATFPYEIRNLIGFDL